MTKSEKLRDEFDAYFKNSPGTYFDALAFFALSPRALVWCRANKELVEALANGTWQAVPKVGSKEIMLMIGWPISWSLEDRQDFLAAMLAAAPKKPEE